MDLPSNNRLCHYYALCLAQNFNRAPQVYYELFHNAVSQPTITRSVGELEQDVGGLCVEREPFRLTPKGHELFFFAKKFIENFLPDWQALKQGEDKAVHFGAPDHAVRRYLLTMSQRVLKKHRLHVQFHPCNEHEIVCGVMKGGLHLGVCALNRPLPPGVMSRPLVEVEPVLLLPTTQAYAHIKSAADLWRLRTVPFPLICADETHSVRTVFDAGLTAMNVPWPEREIAATTALITMMVPAYGLPGLSLNLDQLTEYQGLRVISLPGFEPVRYGPVWSEPLNELQQHLLKEIELIAREVQLTPVESAAAARLHRQAALR